MYFLEKPVWSCFRCIYSVATSTGFFLLLLYSIIINLKYISKDKAIARVLITFDHKAVFWELGPTTN